MGKKTSEFLSPRLLNKSLTAFRIVSGIHPCLRVRQIPKSNIFIHRIIYFLDASVYLSEKLDKRGFMDGFSFIWMIWTQKPQIQVEGWGWLFKVFLWCLR